MRKNPNSINPIGGQALVEGVMMRSKDKIACANRLPNGKIVYKKTNFKSITKNGILSLPFIRGIVMLFEILYEGMKMLMYSTNLQVDDDEQLSTSTIILTVLLSLAFAILLFKFFPLIVSKLIAYTFVINNTFFFNIIDGIIRISVFLIYLVVIAKMEDVKILFQYHGAEHKTVHCYEHKEKLTIANVKKYSTLHPRCGTAFVLYNFVISIFIFTLIPIEINFWKLFLYRLPLLFPIAGISYELIKLSNKYKGGIVKFLVAPGLWMQKITTKEPTNKQIEVAIKALEKAL